MPRRPHNKPKSALRHAQAETARREAKAARVRPDRRGSATFPAESRRRADEIHCLSYHEHARWHRQLAGGWTCCLCGPRPAE